MSQSIGSDPHRTALRLTGVNPLLVLIFFAPESPWWLVRRGRSAEALRSIERLGRRSKQNAHEALAMMERLVEIERHLGGNPTLLDLFKGTDRRRTIITCLIYAGQNFAGNLIASQATYFFERTCVETPFEIALSPLQRLGCPKPSLSS